LPFIKIVILESEIRLRLREVGPKTINEAENIAVRLEALRMAIGRKEELFAQLMPWYCRMR
jgi:hypothetical protein